MDWPEQHLRRGMGAIEVTYKIEKTMELCKYVWFLRNNNFRFDLKWSIKKKAKVYSAGAKYCDLCLTEKTIIMLADKKSCLNIRSEILRKCPHISKFTLGMVKPDIPPFPPDGEG